MHFDDIAKLLAAFRKLLESGASLLVIEHNLDVIKSADWLVDLGPEGGDQGGKIIATGTPEQVARNAQSHTGRYLARVLNENGRAKGVENGASKIVGAGGCGERIESYIRLVCWQRVKPYNFISAVLSKPCVRQSKRKSPKANTT